MSMFGAIPKVDKDFQVQDYIPGQPIPPLVRDPKTGRIILNELKKWVKPFMLTTEPAEITLGPGEVSQPFPMPLDGKGHFEVMRGHFKSSQQEGFAVTIFDPGGVQVDRPLLMNREVHVATIAAGGTTDFASSAIIDGGSSGGRPFVWPETFWMNVDEGTKCLFVTFRNLSTEDNTIHFVLEGLRWYHTLAPQKIADRMIEIYRRRFRTMPFFFTTEEFIELGVAGGGTDSGSFEMRFGDDAWTEIHKLMSWSNNREFTAFISEKATGKRFMDAALHRKLVFGDGQFPFLMWEPTLFEPNYKLQFDLVNLDQELATNSIWITAACRRFMIDPKEVDLARV